MKFRVDLFGSTEIVDINRDQLFSARQVAVTLGISVETLRRWIKDGSFPRSIIHSSVKRQDFWLKIDVLEFQKIWLLRSFEPKKRARFKNLDAIDHEEEKRYARLPLHDQGLQKSFSRMFALIQNDPKELARTNPNLQRWLKFKGYI
ncbi:hypothetical protein K3172_15365 [Qipengyuania sp. 6B39]|uniref:helix-turn-helix transcriptional regulator n=1 Tax=Qipengyuania proteolytica TaxID=2867239 RepID=UPI001C8A6649|nr:hypothetical protein [Qipengyuania proteolytica]MBX7497238.1 hypothetical protein [Qipengyuania proteolytica]